MHEIVSKMPQDPGGQDIRSLYQLRRGVNSRRGRRWRHNWEGCGRFPSRGKLNLPLDLEWVLHAPHTHQHSTAKPIKASRTRLIHTTGNWIKTIPNPRLKRPNRWKSTNIGAFAPPNIYLLAINLRKSNPVALDELQSTNNTSPTAKRHTSKHPSRLLRARSRVSIDADKTPIHLHPTAPNRSTSPPPDTPWSILRKNPNLNVSDSQKQLPITTKD
ncbi:Uncharacterized protein Rs2_42024 [Raphanus sativus]|nr:Uncharacterized protein Rs2_42024 [Raphanus sativus]